MIGKVDPLGRIVIPKELRKVLNIEEADPIEIFIENEYIILKKYSPNRACALTGEVTNENLEVAPGLLLSPSGRELMLQKLQSV